MLRLCYWSALMVVPRIEDILPDEVLVPTNRPDELFILRMFLWWPTGCVIHPANVLVVADRMCYSSCGYSYG